MIVHEYLKVLVLDCKIVTYEYFVDDIQEWEIQMLMNISHESHRTEWETARYITYYNTVMSGNLKKQYTEKPMTDLFPLPYDDKFAVEEHEIEITNNQIEDLKNRSKRVKEKLFKKKVDG